MPQYRCLSIPRLFVCAGTRAGARVEMNPNGALFILPFINLPARGALSTLVLKKVNVLTFKLKSHLGKVGGHVSVVGKREKKKRGGGGPLGWEGLADESGIEFQLGLTYIYIQPTWQCLAKLFSASVQTTALNHFHKLKGQMIIILCLFIILPTLFERGYKYTVSTRCSHRVNHDD